MERDEGREIVKGRGKKEIIREEGRMEGGSENHERYRGRRHEGKTGLTEGRRNQLRERVNEEGETEGRLEE